MDQIESSPLLRDSAYGGFQNTIFITGLLLFVVATLLAYLNRNIAIISAVYGAGAMCLIFAFLPHFRKFQIFGLKAEVNNVKETQRTQSKDIELVQRLSFAGIVSKYEINHLYGLADKQRNYDVRYSQDLRNELKRLDDFGFIYPNDGMGLNTLDERFGADINRYEAWKKTLFNLRDYYHITEYGERYIELSKKLGLPERP